MKLLYLDQNFLSDLAKKEIVGDHIVKGFIEKTSANSIQLVISPTHYFETSKANNNLQTKIFNFLKNFQYVESSTATEAIFSEMRHAFLNFLGVSSQGCADIFNTKPKDFLSQIASAKNIGLPEIERNFTLELKAIQEQKRRVNTRSDIKKQIVAEFDALIEDTKNKNEIWGTPSFLYPFSLHSQRVHYSEFVSKIQIEISNLNVSKRNDYIYKYFPVQYLYISFNLYRFGDLRINKKHYKTHDTEHAVVGGYFCDYLICEKSMKNTLDKMQRQNLIKAKIFCRLQDFLDC